MSEVKENKMGVMPVTKLVVTMSIPMMISMLVQAFYNVVDSFFVAKVCEEALTAVSLAFPIQNLMIAFSTGLGVGVNALLSKSLGEKNYERVDRLAAHGVIMAMILSAFFMAFGLFFTKPYMATQVARDSLTFSYGVDYLSIVSIFSFGIFGVVIMERLMQATGKTTLAMTTQIIGAVINIVFDPILILGLGPFPRLEAKGAAIATVMGQVIGFVVGIFLNIFKNREVRLKLKLFRLKWQLVKEICVIGIPSTVMTAMGSVMMFFFNKILISFTETAAAVFGVFFRLRSIFFMPVFGLNNGVIPIISYNYGAKRKDRMKKSVKVAIVFALCVMIVGTVLMLAIPQVLLGFFDPSPKMLEIGVPAFRIACLIFPMAAVGICLSGALQAVGKSFYSMIVSIVREVVVLLPVAYFLSKTGVLNYVWISFPIAELVSLVLSIVFYFHVRKILIDKI